MDDIEKVKPTTENEESKFTELETSQQKDQNTTMPRSHLRRTLVKQSRKTLFLSGLGLVVIIVLLIIFGQELLVNFSVLLGNTKNGTNNEKTQEEKIIYIAPPLLDPQPEATNSATINVTGVEPSDLKTQVKLYVNDELADVVKPDSDNSFQFENIELKEGKNEIRAIAEFEKEKSVDSNILIISYLKNAPELNIEYPQDGTKFTGQSNLTIKGKTDSGNTVLVNDYIAITKNDGSFTYNFNMQNGDNKIKITAQNEAGNKTEKEIKVVYSP